jgi:hypothetical protein
MYGGYIDSDFTTVKKNLMTHQLTCSLVTVAKHCMIAAALMVMVMPTKNVEASANDTLAIRKTREGMINVISFMKTRPDIFPSVKKNEKQLFTHAQRQAAWHTWQTFLDQVLAFDTLGQKYSAVYRDFNGEQKKEPFYLAYAAFLAQYRLAMDFINITKNNPSLHIVLNEPVPELGLPKGSYSRLKYRFLNVLRGAEFARLSVLYQYYSNNGPVPLQEEIEEDSKLIWQAGKGEGPKQTARNALQIVKDQGFTAWFPVQKQVSEWMSDIKVWRKGKTLISDQQIKGMIGKLEPGDVLLERREWFMTNVGMPGFWPHAALYIGSPAQREKYFDDPQVETWIKSKGHSDGTFEDFLRTNYPGGYKISTSPDRLGETVRVIEAKGEGVIFTSLQYSAGADSVVAMRPRLSKVTKARAIARAFNYSGRPYDFNFDFLTDEKLVCTELVYKAYEGTAEIKGLDLPVADIMGRKVTPANLFAKLFDEEYGMESQQFDFVFFLDGDERKEGAFEADVDAFRSSWKRPKWHIIVKDTPFETVE